MKNLSFLFLCFSIISQAQTLRTPAASPTQVIKQDFALSFIEINYSRPSMKGRTIFGEKSNKTVVPYGELWRTGANRATRVSFGEDVKILGNALKAGDYALYTVPGKSEWEIVFNKGINNGGTAGYKTEEDVLRVKVKPTVIANFVETFTMQIINITANTCEIQIAWEKTAVSIPVIADVDSKVMASIDQLMNKDNHPYHAAAQYYFDNGKDLKQALEWENKAVEMAPDAFWMFHLKAKIQAKLGDKVGAVETAKKSIELAKKAQNNDYVRLNEELIASVAK
jgi:tetratricopeptide (TPR) repeat protein